MRFLPGYAPDLNPDELETRSWCTQGREMPFRGGGKYLRAADLLRLSCNLRIRKRLVLRDLHKKTPIGTLFREIALADAAQPDPADRIRRARGAALLCGEHFRLQACDLGVRRRDATALHGLADQHASSRDTHRAPPAKCRGSGNDYNPRSRSEQEQLQFITLHARSMTRPPGRSLMQIKSTLDDVKLCGVHALAGL